MVIHSKILFIPVASFAMLILAFAFSSSSMGLSLLSSLFNTNTHAASSASQFTVSLGEVLTMSAPDAINLTNCNPSTSTLCTASADITVSTNNLTGYSLYMNATNGSSTDLTNTIVTPNPTIPTLSESYSSANFPVNSWGYTGGTDQSAETGGYNCATNYCPILAYESSESSYAPNHIINATDAPAATSTTNLTFGAKADTSKASGTYSTSVTFTAVANEVPAQPIQNGMNMQDIDSATCAATPLYSESSTTYTVVDSRDSTNYTVARLADGNCWMTQNLALGGDTAMNLTQANSNVGPGGFTLPASVTEGSWTGSYTDPEFFDYAGNYDDSTTKYGNYYNWSAATAGTNPSSGDSAYDICPKNWRLPSASTTAIGSEFHDMLDPYIITGYWSGSDWYNLNVSELTNTPVSLAISGYCYYGAGSHGDYAAWWSSTTNYSGSAYGLYLSNEDRTGDPRLDISKDLGYSVRCLVPGT